MISFLVVLRRCVGDVGLGGRVAGHPDDDDAPERAVGVAVSAGVEAVPLAFAGGHFDRAGAAECGEGVFVGQPLGLSPAATSRAPAVSTPTPWRATSRGAAVVTRVLSWVSRAAISASRCAMRRATEAMAVLAAAVGSVTGPGRQPGGGAQPLSGGRATERVADLVGGGVDQGVQLVAGLPAGLDGALAGVAQQPDRLDRADAVLGDRGGPAGDDRPGCFYRRRSCRTCRSGVGADGWAGLPPSPRCQRRPGTGPVRRPTLRCPRHRPPRPARSWTTIRPTVGTRRWWWRTAGSPAPVPAGHMRRRRARPCGCRHRRRHR